MKRTRCGLASVLAAVIALAATTAWAGPATDLVKTSVDQVLAIVQDPEMKKPANADKRRTRMREVARGLFDFEDMAKRALARHWAQRTPEQRKRFAELFADLLEASYVSRIESYGGEKITYPPEVADGDVVTVRQRVTTKGGVEIPLEYRLHTGGDRWKVYDVAIEGVSLVSNYRTQFNQIITRSSYEELVKRLEQKQLEVAEELKTRKSAPKTP